MELAFLLTPGVLLRVCALQTFHNEDLSGSRTESRDDRSNWADGENVIKVGGTHQQATTQRQFLDKRSSFAMVMERMAVTERVREFLVRQEFWNWWVGCAGGEGYL